PSTVRSTAVWLRDGNIILRTKTRMFRLYEGLLARKSVIFEDIFALPQSDRSDEAIDGCRVLDLQDDADELELFLLAIIEAE
ncbi:hypothetical protein DFH06DRAFT_913658, partial [Mycena polygramma]